MKNMCLFQITNNIKYKPMKKTPQSIKDKVFRYISEELHLLQILVTRKLYSLEAFYQFY